jgi:hypothetical protein
LKNKQTERTTKNRENEKWRIGQIDRKSRNKQREGEKQTDRHAKRQTDKKLK